MDAEKTVMIDFTEMELVAINNALNEVCHGPEAIPETEFQTRMGVERTSAQQILRRISALFESFR